MKLSITGRIKMAGKILATGNVEDHIRAFLSGESVSSPGEIDASKAMKYSAVNACVRVLAETYASAPLVLYQKNKDGRDPVENHLLYDILHNRPNEEMSPYTFAETVMVNLCTGGNAVCEKLVNKDGQLVGLYPYPYTATEIKRDERTYKLVYTIAGKPENKTLQRSQVLHIPNLSFGGVVGLSPLSLAAETIRLGLSYEAYGINFYKNAATPSGVFEHPTKLSESAFERLRKDLDKNYTGLKNSGVPMILEEGMKWNQVTVNPVDAQLLESKNFQIEDICRIFRVPQHLVNKLDRSTNNNIEHQSLEFVMYTMLPHWKRAESNMNMQLLSDEDRKKGLYLEHKVDGLLRGDAVSRAQAYAHGRQWGWLSVNDIRKLENMPPIGNGDIYLQPSNMIEAGKQAGDVYNRLVDDIYKMIEERR